MSVYDLPESSGSHAHPARAGRPHGAADVPIAPSPGWLADGQGAGAVSWGAILAGALGAAALSLILLVLGVGLGLSAVSPWSGRGAQAGTLGVAAIAWIAFTQIAASGLGGYLAGRLRRRWVTTTAGDEVYFRDTAHGFLAWALATLVTAATLTSAIGGVLGSTAQAGATVAAAGASGAAAGAVPAAAQTAGADGGLTDADRDYAVDRLFREASGAPATPADAGPANAAAGAASAPAGGASDAAVAPASPATTTATSTATGGAGSAPVDPAAQAALNSEARNILLRALSTGTLANDDAQHLGRRVADATGMGQAEAERRVRETFTQLQARAKELETRARATADEARKASVHASLWTFIALLAGAFVASLMATFGGRQRDRIDL